MSAPTRTHPFPFDYRRHLAAQDLQPAHQEDFQRLVKLLRHAPGFQLYFARIRDPLYRDALIGKLGELLGATARPMAVFDLSERDRFPDFAALENALSAADRRQTTIHLINGDAWLNGANLASFNLRRNALADKLQAILLWWLPAAAVARVAEQAPDVWSWRGGVFDSADSPMPGPAVPEPPPQYALTLAQRSQRLAVLNQQLAQEVPDEFRLALLLERADLLASLGQWRGAETELRQEALPLAEKRGAVRERAITQGRIADNLYDLGELDEALRIRREEELPVFEALGDVRELLVCRTNLAILLITRHQDGDLDEARALLENALLEARRLRLPEEESIRKLLVEIGYHDGV